MKLDVRDTYRNRFMSHSEMGCPWFLWFGLEWQVRDRSAFYGRTDKLHCVVMRFCGDVAGDTKFYLFIIKRIMKTLMKKCQSELSMK